MYARDISMIIICVMVAVAIVIIVLAFFYSKSSKCSGCKNKQKSTRDHLKNIYDDLVQGSVNKHEILGEVFVISLEKDQHRLNSTMSLLNRLGISVTHFKAYVPNEDDRIKLVKSRVLTEDNNLNEKGVLGCAISHAAIWTHMISSNVPVCTIFEDDVHSYIDKSLLEERLNSMIQTVPKNWDIIFLGRCSDRCDRIKKLAHGIYQTFSPSCTHAYMISQEGAIKILKHGINTAIDTVIREMCRNGTLSAFTFHPSIFVQDILEYTSSLRDFRGQIKSANDCDYF